MSQSPEAYNYQMTKVLKKRGQCQEVNNGGYCRRCWRRRWRWSLEVRFERSRINCGASRGSELLACLSFKLQFPLVSLSAKDKHCLWYHNKTCTLQGYVHASHALTVLLSFPVCGDEGRRTPDGSLAAPRQLQERPREAQVVKLQLVKRGHETTARQTQNPEW